VIRVIKDHLQPDDRRAPTLAPWHGLDLDFTGVVFDGGNLSGAQFSGGDVSFFGAQFSGGDVDLSQAADWSAPPRFDHGPDLPAGLRLPSG